MQQEHVAQPHPVSLQRLPNSLNHFVGHQIAAPFAGLQFEGGLEPVSHVRKQQSYNRSMSYYGRRLLFGILAIYFSHMTTGWMTERLFNHQYPSTRIAKDGSTPTHYFTHPSLVTWAGCLFCTLYGLIYAKLTQEKPNAISHPERMRLGLLFTLNYLPTNYALLYVSYPLQVIAKNTRYLLVVVVGVFFSRVQKSRELKLPRSKMYIALLITVGAGLFMYFESLKKGREGHLDPSKRWIGYLLLLLAIICDALFSDSQAYCKATFKPTSNQLFLASNFYGFLLIFLFALFSGALLPSIRFCLRHPSCILDVAAIGIFQILGQISVYYVVSNFKQHIYPLISTTRKIFTVLLSIFSFHHTINHYQWVALVILFLAMGYELVDEVQSQEHHRAVRKQRLEKGCRESAGSSQIQASVVREEEGAKPAAITAESLAPLNLSTRTNRFMETTPIAPAPADESLSKYRYSWRMGEVVQNRETSLSPSPLEALKKQ